MTDERFWTKVDRRGPGECWRWLGRTQEGYGKFDIGTTTIASHRYAYRAVRGVIANGLTLDHLCHNVDPQCAGGELCRHRRCVNPAHLEAVTSRVNTFRGKGPGPTNAAKTHCKRGHEFTPENTIVDRPGRRAARRQCRACHSALQRRRYRERAA